MYYFLKMVPEEEVESSKPEPQTARVIQDDLELVATEVGMLN
jgi:hypothetical protein